jgi:hypothetical protein
MGDNNEILISIPSLGQINEILGEFPIDPLSEYHIRTLERIACWIANPHLHSDLAFKTACLGLGHNECLTRDIHWHIKELFRGSDYPAAVVYGVIKDFEQYANLKAKL